MVLFTIMADISGQPAHHSNPDKEFYLSRSRNQKNTAWILLLSGTAMTIGGSVAFDKSWDEGSAMATDIFGYITLAGVMADLASIPFFISAGKNKRRAASISFNLQHYPPCHYIAGNTSPCASILLRIPL